MFTTFNVSHIKACGLRRTLHLPPKRKFIHNCHHVYGNDFYTTRLLTPTDNNQKIINRFHKCCSMPIITNNSETAIRYKYLLTLNTLLKSIEGSSPNIAMVDPSGKLIHLLDKLLSVCRIVGVYTKQTNEYIRKNEQLFSLIGASAILYDDIRFIRKFDIIFSFAPLNSDSDNIFGHHGIFCNDIPLLPDNIAKLQLSNDEIIPALSGLYFHAKQKKLGNLYCKKLSKSDIISTVNDKILYV